MSDEPQFAIWWTSQPDCEAIGDALPETLPAYMRQQYRSRLGRNGRGRLWLSTALGLPVHFGVDWPDSTPLADRLGADYGGIVIRAADAPLLAEMPGIVTGLDVRQLVCTDKEDAVDQIGERIDQLRAELTAAMRRAEAAEAACITLYDLLCGQPLQADVDAVWAWRALREVQP